jgi:UDP-N-acetylglucosamine--N-acetylmuramyl-(pentapeptide) pyrophosphoryl-undecaprenol N-acetylglucosamine transferase
MTTRRILFTGGGTAGHVTPNVALIERCLAEGWQVFYAGSPAGIEKTIIEPLGIAFYPISSGKLRRYFSWRNFIDPFKVLLGVMQAMLLCWRLKPDVIFSKGGFVSVPLAIAGWLLRIPVIIHESDMTPGLANRLCVPLAHQVCVTFPQTRNYLPEARVTGTPVRRAILDADPVRGRQFLSVSADRPVILVIGGSLGSETINRVVRQSLQQLLIDYQVVHICGKGNCDPALADLDGYHQVEFLDAEFGDVLAVADLVVSRAGANSIYEFLVMQKPAILIPLSARASRGDQLVNAREFSEAGYGRVLHEDALSSQTLVDLIADTMNQRHILVDKLARYELPDSVEQIFQLLASARQIRKSPAP